MGELIFSPGAIGFALGALLGFVAGALCTVKVFLIMHANSINGKG